MAVWAFTLIRYTASSSLTTSCSTSMIHQLVHSLLYHIGDPFSSNGSLSLFFFRKREECSRPVVCGPTQTVRATPRGESSSEDTRGTSTRRLHRRRRRREEGFILLQTHTRPRREGISFLDFFLSLARQRERAIQHTHAALPTPSRVKEHAHVQRR